MSTTNLNDQRVGLLGDAEASSYKISVDEQLDAVEAASSTKGSLAEPFIRESSAVSEKESLSIPRARSRASTLLQTVSEQEEGGRCTTARVQRIVGTVLFVAILCAVVFFYAVVPHIAQDSINKSTVTLGETNITNPTADSMTLDSEMTIHLDAPLPVSAKVEGGYLHWYFEDPDLGELRLGKVHLPSITAHAGSTKIARTVRGAKATISDWDNWHHFMSHASNDETVTMCLRGYTRVRVTLIGDSEDGWQHFVENIRLDKKVTVLALNSIQGAHFTDFDTLTTTTSEYPQMSATIALDNPSMLNILPVGQMTAKVYFEGDLMAVAHTVHNISLVRGRNVFKVKGPCATTNVSRLNTLVSRMLAGLATDTIIISSNVTDPYSDPHWPKDAGWGDYNPAVSTPLFARGLQGVQMPFTCKWPGPPVNLTTESIVDVSARYIHPIDGTVVPLWFGINNVLSARMHLRKVNYVATYEGGVFGYISANNISTLILPNAVQLSGFNLSNAVKVSAPTTPTSIDVFLQLESVEKGWTYVSAYGTFTVEIGCLTLDLWNNQPGRLPCCALSYLHKPDAPKNGGMCGNPNATIINGGGIWHPNE